MAKVATSYMRTNGATVTRAVDVLVWSNVTGRPSALTGYIRFIEIGANSEAVARNVWQISDTSRTRPMVNLRTNTNGQYLAELGGAVSTTTATAAAVATLGQVVEIRVTITVSGMNGTVTIGQSLDGGAEVAVTSTAVVMGVAWSQACIRLGGTGNVAATLAAVRDLFFYRGVHSMATMRRLAGT